MTPTIIDGQRYCTHHKYQLADGPGGDPDCPWCLVENLEAEREKDQAAMREAKRLLLRAWYLPDRDRDAIHVLAKRLAENEA